MTEERSDALSVLDQYTAGLANGFSATVFRLGGVPYFAIRGSSDLADFALADVLGIVAQGAARAQAVEMYRYWRRLTTPLDQPVNYSQAELKYMAGVLLPSLNPLTLFAGASSLIAAAVADRGLGVLPPNAQVVVTGHSLGGHLAQLFYEMFPQSVQHVYTYNGAGVGGAAFDLAERLLGLIGRSANVPVSGITNLVAEHGFNLTAGFGRFLGETQQVFNEKSLLPWENHFIDKLTDSLALYDVFGKIDAQLSLASITSILDAGSNVAALSLRSVLGKLVDVFRLQGTGVDLPSPGTDRQSYFASLLPLGSLLDLPSSATSLAIRSLADLDAQTLLGLARAPEEGLAYRYALSELNPFAVLGADYSRFDRLEDLRLYDPIANTGAMTDKWLADRAGYLAAVNFRNSHDLTDSITQGRGPIDYATIDAEGNRVPLRIAGAAGSAATTQIVFGSGANDLVQGNAGGDHLYGADGGDTLEGREGNDYLEGGRGADQLAGGSGDDTLAGGDADDVLTGGQGNDVLEGGSGNDIYRYFSGDGTDTIRDSDGLGAIVYDGATLTGGDRVAGGLYWDATHTIRYAFAGDPAQRGTLEINGNIAIRNFRNGDFGITLTTSGVSSPVDGTINLRYLEGPYLRAEDDSFSEVNAYGSAFNDLFVGPGDLRSEFYGKAGDDVIVSSANASGEAAYLTGGSGNDRITSSVSGIDFSSRSEYDIPVIAGGGGRDWIEGSADPEALFGDLHRMYAYTHPSGWTKLSLDAFVATGRADSDAAGSWRTSFYGVGDDEHTYRSLDEAVSEYLGVTSDTDLSSYYDDYIDAGAGGDYLVGGAGSDVLIGGEGDDTLVADVLAYAYVPNYAVIWTGLADVMPLFVGPGEDYLEGGPGNDHLVGHDGDYLDGGPGDDVLVDWNLNGVFLPVQDDTSDESASRQIVMIGGEGDDQIKADAQSVYVDGGEGNDIIEVWTSPDCFALIMAGEGDDDIFIESGAAEVDGGAGNDVYRISTLSTITISDQDANAENVDRIEISDLGWPGLSDFSSRAMLIGRDGFDLVIEADPAQMLDELLDPDQPLFSLTISNWFAGDEYKIEQIQFGSGEFGFDPDEMEAGEFDIAQFLFDPAAIEAEMAARALEAAAAAQTLQADSAGSTIVGAGGNDNLLGGEGEDTLVGGAGNDTLSGGPGDDALDGGVGDDTYRFDIGDGRDTIADASTPEAPNSLVFGPGITPASVTLQPGALLVGPSENGDEIQFASFDPDDPEGSHPIENLQFDDGTVLTYTDLLARGFDINGSDADEVVTGTALPDRIGGGAGDDLLLGADDSDEYVFTPGWGDDTLIDWGGDGDTLSFGSGISPDDVRVSSVDGRIVLEHGEDSVAIDWLPEEGLAIERVEFANGEEWDQAALELLAAEAPAPPAETDPDPADSSSADSSPSSQDAGSQDPGQTDAADSAQAADGTDAQPGPSGDAAPATTDQTDTLSASSQETSDASESLPQDPGTEETDSQATSPSNADSQNSPNDASSTAEESGTVTGSQSDSAPDPSSESGDTTQSEAVVAPESPSPSDSEATASGEPDADSAIPEAEQSSEQPIAADEQSDDGVAPVAGQTQASDGDVNASDAQTQATGSDVNTSGTQAEASDSVAQVEPVSSVNETTAPVEQTAIGNSDANGATSGTNISEEAAQPAAGEAQAEVGAEPAAEPAANNDSTSELSADGGQDQSAAQDEAHSDSVESAVGQSATVTSEQVNGNSVEGSAEGAQGSQTAQAEDGMQQRADADAIATHASEDSPTSGTASSDSVAQVEPASSVNETTAPVEQTAVGNSDANGATSGSNISEEAAQPAAGEAQAEVGAEPDAEPAAEPATEPATELAAEPAAEPAPNNDSTSELSADGGQDQSAAQDEAHSDGVESAVGQSATVTSEQVNGNAVEGSAEGAQGSQTAQAEDGMPQRADAGTSADADAIATHASEDSPTQLGEGSAVADQAAGNLEQPAVNGDQSGDPSSLGGSGAQTGDGEVHANESDAQASDSGAQLAFVPAADATVALTQQVPTGNHDVAPSGASAATAEANQGLAGEPTADASQSQGGAQREAQPGNAQSDVEPSGNATNEEITTPTAGNSTQDEVAQALQTPRSDRGVLQSTASGTSTDVESASENANISTADDSAGADANAVHDPNTAVIAEDVVAADTQAKSIAFQDAQFAGSGQIHQVLQYRSSIDQYPVRTEAAQRELQRQIDAFFAHITPAPLATQRWLDEWLPAGARPVRGERTFTRESNEAVAGAYSSDESAEAAGLQDASGVFGDSAADADLAARYADMHAWLDDHAGLEANDFSGISWAQGVFALHASAWLGADQPVGMTLSGAAPGMTASLNPNFSSLGGLREGFSLLRAG